MYIRKIQGPHAVTLPDGSTMTRSDLPSAKTTRWVASRKAAVVHAVDHGLMTSEEAIRTYSLSKEELESWRMAVSKHGEKALKTTALQKFRE
ncbi:CtrA inhibitor SciP [Gymnodinialimonas hymeniacidonis]|uniref:CtrA inhibitor SciP n=1 Tax=Gymnodinialimonas hymeniacidonis TaxID=3126508 RepID=UPI0034C62018